MATLSVGGTTVFNGSALQSGVTVADMSNFTFPSGHILQCKGDRYDHKAEGSAVACNISSTTPFGADLEVAITCKSTSNFLVLQLFFPDIYTGTNTNGLHSGFVYDTNSFASSFTGLPGTAGNDTRGKYIVGPYFLYGLGSHDIMHLPLMVYTEVPTISPMKIRPWVQSHSSETYDIGGNYASFSDQTSLIVMEVQS
jgi:hypothetical protein